MSYPTFLVVSLVTHHLVSTHVPLPFIDEFFHVRQCQQYCGGDFLTWDPKITTPPGLYYLGYVYTFLTRLFTSHPCGIEALRGVNVLGGVVMVPLLVWMLLPAASMAVASFPLLFIYYFLFYTDVWSTVLIVASLVLVVRLPFGPTLSAYASAFVGLLSVTFRQTNIVWLGFNAVVLLDCRLATAPPAQSTGSNLSKGNTTTAQVTALNSTGTQDTASWASVERFVRQALIDWKLLLPFGIDAALFGVFLLLNGSITFGDKENHAAGLHLVQVFYCTTFMAGFGAPLWVSKTLGGAYARCWFGSGKRLLAFAGLMLLILLCIQHFTLVHPFMLADNRHYIFYLWRRIIDRTPYTRYALAPLYHFCAWVVCTRLSPSPRTASSPSLHLSVMARVAYFACVAATLIPSPLFEPRYYILPYVYWRIFTQPVTEPVPVLPITRHQLEFWFNMAVNVGVVGVFIGYAFEWPNEPGVVQRIIW